MLIRVYLGIVLVIGVIALGCSSSPSRTEQDRSPAEKADASAASAASAGSPTVVPSVQAAATTPSPKPAVTAAGLPALTGPFALGTTIRHLVDQARPDPFAEDPAARRELVVQFWYPAGPQPGAEPVLYCPDCDVLGVYLGRRNPPPVVEELAVMRARAVADAPPAGAPERFPVITFSHGFETPRFVYTAQAEELASHGYVVASIEHTYGTFATRFPDGRVVTFRRPRSDLELIRLQAADVRFVVDALADLDARDPGGLLAGRLDMGRLGMMGHSYGGATATLACSLEPRCTASVDYDGAVLPEAYDGGQHKPLMVFNSVRFAGNNRDILTRWSSDAYLVVIDGTIHNDFSDAPLLPFSGPRAGGTIQPHRGFHVYSTYTRAFFDTYLQGERRRLLAGPSPDYPEVRIEGRQR